MTSNNSPGSDHSGKINAPAAQQTPLDTNQKRVLVLAFGATMSVVLGVSSIMPAIPHMAEEFGIPHTEASLLITIFTLPGIILAPIVGIWSDRYGRKPILMCSFLMFALAGVACAFAPSFNVLLFFRFLQGLGGIGLGILYTTIIGDSFTGQARARYIGYNAALLSVGTGLYPVIGGFLAEFSWHAPFALPLVALVFCVVGINTHLPYNGSAQKLGDYCLDALRMMRKKNIASLLVVTLLTFTMLYGPIITAFPLLGHDVFSATPSEIGLLMFFSSSGTALIALTSGKLSVYVKYTTQLFIGQGLFMLSLALIVITPNFWLLTIPIFIYGIGQGLTVPTIQYRLLGSVGPEQRGALMAANGTLLRIGQTIAPFLFSLLAQWQGNMAPFWAGVGIAFGTSLLIFFCLTRPNR